MTNISDLYTESDLRRLVAIEPNPVLRKSYQDKLDSLRKSAAPPATPAADLAKAGARSFTSAGSHGASWAHKQVFTSLKDVDALEAKLGRRVLPNDYRRVIEQGGKVEFLVLDSIAQQGQTPEFDLVYLNITAFDKDGQEVNEDSGAIGRGTLARAGIEVKAGTEDEREADMMMAAGVAGLAKAGGSDDLRKYENTYCDGAGDRGNCSGEVRRLPFSNGNLNLCRAHFQKEMYWRQRQNQDAAKDDPYDIPKWESLAVVADSKGEPTEKSARPARRGANGLRKGNSRPLTDDEYDIVNEVLYNNGVKIMGSKVAGNATVLDVNARPMGDKANTVRDAVIEALGGDAAATFYPPEMGARGAATFRVGVKVPEGQDADMMLAARAGLRKGLATGGRVVAKALISDGKKADAKLVAAGQALSAADMHLSGNPRLKEVQKKLSKARQLLSECRVEIAEVIESDRRGPALQSETAPAEAAE